MKYINERCISENYKKQIDEYEVMIDSHEEEINRLKEKIARNGHIIRYHIQKLDPFENGRKLNEEYFKRFVEDCKLKMVNEMIDKGLVKVIDYDNFVEIAIHLAEDEE